MNNIDTASPLISILMTVKVLTLRCFVYSHAENPESCQQQRKIYYDYYNLHNEFGFKIYKLNIYIN
jgi:hypothetical protein